ncbi:uncharacterized protein [Aristolochia californica]|uniref:uncharacterized protein n=1 Tax=Aristolochia californica TaxID=171875 RepID=UPI0035E094A4
MDNTFVSELERAPTLFSIKADEQLKALANRSQFSGGYDLWSERDETQLFHNQDWLPSARFFLKGAMHNVKPYGIIDSVGHVGHGVLAGAVVHEEACAKKHMNIRRGMWPAISPTINRGAG